MHSETNAWREHHQKEIPQQHQSIPDLTSLIEILDNQSSEQQQQSSSNNQSTTTVNHESVEEKNSTNVKPKKLTMFQRCSSHVERLLTILQPSLQSEERRMFVFNAISNLLGELGLKV